MQSPSSHMVAQALAPAECHDAQGRTLCVRPITALDRLRVYKALGPALSQNASYVGMALLAASVSTIDGVPVPAPGNEAQVEALVARLGDHGIAAAARAMQPGQEPETDPGN